MDERKSLLHSSLTILTTDGLWEILHPWGRLPFLEVWLRCCMLVANGGRVASFVVWILCLNLSSFLSVVHGDYVEKICPPNDTVHQLRLLWDQLLRGSSLRSLESLKEFLSCHLAIGGWQSSNSLMESLQVSLNWVPGSPNLHSSF